MYHCDNNRCGCVLGSGEYFGKNPARGININVGPDEFSQFVQGPLDMQE